MASVLRLWSKEEQSVGEIIVELWAFMAARKKFWLLPVIMLLLTLGALVMLTEGSAVAPFIYTLF